MNCIVLSAITAEPIVLNVQSNAFLGHTCKSDSVHVDSLSSSSITTADGVMGKEAGTSPSVLIVICPDTLTKQMGVLSQVQVTHNINQKV